MSSPAPHGPRVSPTNGLHNAHSPRDDSPGGYDVKRRSRFFTFPGPSPPRFTGLSRVSASKQLFGASLFTRRLSHRVFDMEIEDGDGADNRRIPNYPSMWFGVIILKWGLPWGIRKGRGVLAHQ